MPEKTFKRICVYCGSSPGLLPEYREAAVRLGNYLADEGMELVYGGSDVGLMREVAESALARGGNVIGVITGDLASIVGHERLTEQHIVDSMHERKMKMFELSDAFVALPGGFGTIEELFEILTWGHLAHHEKPCGVLNIAGYFDNIMSFLDHAVTQRFVREEHRSMFLTAATPEELFEKFRVYEPPRTDKWIDRE